MADSLFLRKGLLANLANAPKVAGAISITTDERAMYLDLSDTERIRIGDFIQVANVTELKSDKYKPWSTTAFYYVEDVNGLYKYNGTDWKLINEKSDFSGDIEALQTNVSTNTADISTLKTSVADNTKAISDEATRAKAAEKANADAVVTEKNRAEAAEEALGTRIDGVNTAISGVSSDLTAEVTRAKAAEKANADNITALQNTKQNTITGAATTVVEDDLTASKVLVSNTEGKIAASSLDSSKLAYLGDVTSNIQSQIDNVNTAHSDLVTTVSNLDKAYKAADAGFETRIAALEDAEEKATAEEVARIEKEYKEADVSINEKITALQQKDSSVDTTISSIQSDISELSSSLEELETTISDGDANTLKDAQEYTDGKVSAEAQARAKAITDLETAYKNADNALNTTISNVSSAVTTETNRAKAEEAKIREEFAAADAALKTEVTDAYKEYVDSKLAAADAMRFMGVITADDTVENQIVTPVEAGHTYKIGEEVVFNGVTYRVGDLLIADADQTGESYTGTWSHVSSGYEDNYDPSLVGDATVKSVTLKSGVNADLGKIVFADNYSEATGGVKLSMAVSGEVTTVTAEMVWGSF